MERQERQIRARGERLARLHRSPDLRRPWQEHEHVAVEPLIEQAPHARRDERLKRPILGSRQVLDRHIEHPALGAEHGRAEEHRDRRGLERGRHHEHAQIGPLSLLQPAQEREPYIAVQVPLMKLVEHHPADAAELLVLQRACWMQEAMVNQHLGIPALHEELADVQQWLRTWQVWVVRSEGRLVGAVRARLDGTDWDIGRIMVAADLQGRGLGRQLLEHAEQAAPEDARRVVLFTGTGSERNLRMYKKAGYRVVPEADPQEAGDWAARSSKFSYR